MPDDKKKDIISKWLAGDPKEAISSAVGVSASSVTAVINEWKRELGSAISEAYRGVDAEIVGHSVNPAEIIQAFKLLMSLKNVGVEAQTADEFLIRFSKVMTSTGVSPEGLANIVRQIMKLADLDGIEIYQIPAQVETLLGQKDELETQVKKLNAEKVALASDIEAQKLTIAETHDDSQITGFDKDLLSQFSELNKQLEEDGLSLRDASAFVQMVKKSKGYGYDFATIIDLVSNVKLLSQERDDLKKELATLRESATSLQNNQREIEQKLSERRAIIDSVEKLSTQLGFEVHDFELLSQQIQRLAQIEGTDYSSAKRKLLDSIAALRKIEPFAAAGAEGVETNEQGKEFSDMLNRLTSKGINEQTLLKSLIVNDIFKVDLDTVAEDLKRYRSISNAVKQLSEVRAKLEADELVLKHKLMALEEQRQRISSSVNQLANRSQSDMAAPGSNQELNKEVEVLAKALRGEGLSHEELKNALGKAIDSLCKTLDQRSLTRKILEHAKLALEHEQGVRAK
jgi:DNA repair exonuclease SbcCD ATPase subunit